jgi:hypothetical protein
MFLYKKLRFILSGVYIIYAPVYSRLISLLRIEQRDNNPQPRGTGKEGKMQNFVLTGKAKTVFRLIELKAKQEAMAKRNKKQDSGNKK